MQLKLWLNWINTPSHGEKRRGLGCFPWYLKVARGSGVNQPVESGKKKAEEFDRKGGGSSMWKQIRQKLHNANLGRLCRRGVALAMAVSMILPSSAYGFDIMVGPIEMVDGEAPTIIVEANAVINRWYDPALGDPTDYLTGEFEVAIRVKSGTRDGELQAFNTVALALKYNADILTPCRWTSKWDDTYGQDNDQREMTDLMPVASSEIYSPSSMTSMQTLKNNKISDATAHVCETVTTETDGGDGYVFIRMDSDRPLVLGDEKREGELFADEQGTVLGVISFSYNVEDYKILAAEAVKWLSAESASAGEGDAVTVPNGDRLIQLATHEELNGKYTDFGVEVSYDSEKNGMFYSSDPNASRFINQPPTFNRLTLNEETYTEKEIKEHQINFVLTNKTTYNDGGLSLDDLATVVFYDWDDTLIGVLIVPRDGDARKLVNDYVCNNMIHPDLRPGGTSTPNYSSMARIDNYRGKYPATAPMVEGGKDTTMDGNRPNDKYVGSNYPLTNKIDYVFLKRPMEKVTTDADGAPITTNTWRQKGEENAEWDTLYPYIYGWALIPDDNLTDIQYTHPENLWTTIGVGELKEYTGALTGGYLELNGAPAELTISGQDFEFADFNFMQKDHSLEPGSVYAVKAVYEPGEDLMIDAYAYRMISEPYYNKMNNPSAANGGAYSVDVTFERTNFDTESCLHGIARARDLQLRQETTADIRWENEYLENATIAQQSAKTKTTYSTVPVDNIDEVDISLVLSGRHNKVDYFLMDAYNYSFVTGGERSQTNNKFEGTAHVIDNYNYGTADSITDRVYYRAEYTDTDGDGVVNDDRSGTHGFVLYGTINNLAQKVTEYVNGDIDQRTFNDYLSLDNFADMNLRINGELVSARTMAVTENAWMAAVRAAKEAHENGDNSWWNVEDGYAEFTYHQIQMYLSDFASNGKATLLSEAAADAQTITWCNLHEECAAARSGKPNTLVKMVKAALAGEKDKLLLLTKTEAETIAHLRADKKGTAFKGDDVSELADALIEAVQGLNRTTGWPSSAITAVTENDWDKIQGWILSSPKPTNSAEVDAAAQLSKDTAWWDKGENAPNTNSLQNVLDATQKAIDTGRDAWINYYRYQEIFEDMKSTGVTPQSYWTTITENLVKDADGNPFDDYGQFREAIKKAVADMGTDRDWNEYQYHILHGKDPALDPDAPNEYPSYWWHNGYSRVTTLASLFVAAQEAEKGNTAVWDMFTVDDLYDLELKDFHFRSGFNGTTDVYTAADFKNFKDAVLEFLHIPGAIRATIDSDEYEKNESWVQLQYYLIHRNPGLDFTNDSVAADYMAESNYYWWRNGADGEVYTGLTSGITTTNVRTLMEAAYRHAINGNPKAFDQLTLADIEKFRLIPSYKKDDLPANWDALDKFADTDAFVTKLDGLMNDVIAAGSTGSATTWRVIQHYILTGTYLPPSTAPPTLPSDLRNDPDGYWWKEGSENPGAIVGPIKTTWDEFVDALVAYMTTDDAAAFDAVIDEYFVASKLDLRGVGNRNVITRYASLTVKQKTAVKETVRTLAYNLKNTQGVSDVDGVNGLVDWYVLQYYLAQTKAANKITTTTNPLVTKEAAKAFCDGKNYAPPAGSVPETASVMTLETDLFMEPGAEEQPGTEESTTIITEAETLLPDGSRLSVKTITTVDPIAGTTKTTTIVTLWDAAGNLISEEVTTNITQTPVGPEETECTCGSEGEEHAEDCPLYTPPESPIKPEEPGCTCGSEGEGHAEDCPLYTAPEAPAEPEEPGCTCGNEGEGHAEDCPLYTVPEAPTEPEEPGCTCGGGETHTEGCPLYEAPEVPVEPPVEPESPIEPEGPPEPGEGIEGPDVPGTEASGSGEGTDLPASKPTEEPELGEQEIFERVPNLSATIFSTKRMVKTDHQAPRRIISLTNLFFDLGGLKMNKTMSKKNISPPGGLSTLFLRADTIERRGAV